ncbi:hypothetical protein, partial [Mesorhizobium sp. M0060]|uniref:hypothetical protein n=1 Tax=Mesorhizobium sp. M0060 TaxID=2956866 RepID=UPI00333839F1
MLGERRSSKRKRCANSKNDVNQILGFSRPFRLFALSQLCRASNHWASKPVAIGASKVSASPITYGFGLDVFRNRQGMSSSIWLCGWPLM